MKQIKQLLVIMISFVVVLSYPAGAFAAGENPILISNQSVYGSVGETTGVYERVRSKQMLNHAAPEDPVDVVKPLNVTENRTKLLGSGSSQRQTIRAEEKAGISKTFHAWNPTGEKYNRVTAKLSYAGSHTNVWVADQQITTAQAEELGKAFDNHIYTSDVTYFGEPAPDNSKVNIVCYTIPSDDSADNAYVAGFFNPNDLTTETDSNRSEMIYIDVHPLMEAANGQLDVSLAYPTLAHELQHLINFSQRVLKDHHDPLDPWIDEGLSMAAEQLYLGQPLQDPLNYYNEDPLDTIRNGLSPLNWHYDGDSLSNYSLSYLFFQYLRAQVNSAHRTDVYKQLIQDPNTGYRAVQDVIHRDIRSNLTFGQFMTDFRLALYYNHFSGRYGFGDLLGHPMLRRNMALGQSSQLTGGGGILVPGHTKIHQSSNHDFQYLNLTPAGPKPLFSDPLSSRQITVTNNKGHYDRVSVKGLHSGDTVRVYSSSHHGLKKQTARGRSTTLYLRQLGSRSGFVYVSVAHANTRESRWTRGYFKGERSATLRRNQIRIYNYRHHYDRVKVYGLKKWDCIRVYNSRKHLIARKYAHGRSLTAYIRQLGRRSGHIYVTVAHDHMSQSYKRYARFRGE
jgi:hypothetical protein